MKQGPILLIFCAALFLSFGFGNVGSAGSENDFRQYKLNQINSAKFFQSLGYLVGQELTIHRIKEKYPNSLLLPTLQFEIAFPELKSKFIEVGESAFGQQKFKKLYENLVEKIENKSSQYEIDEKFVTKFHQTLLDRSEGNIVSPFLETFLSVLYLDSPFKEYVMGHKQSFSSLNHKKSKGVHVEFELPKSWGAKEGKRPNTLRQWTSQNGHGQEAINIVISDLPYALSDIEIETIFNDKDQSQFVPMPKFIMWDKYFSEIEGQKTVFMESSGLIKRGAAELYMYTQQVFIFFEDKQIVFTCAITDSNNDIATAGGDLIRPLCNAVVNSVVLPELY